MAERRLPQASALTMQQDFGFIACLFTTNIRIIAEERFITICFIFISCREWKLSREKYPVLS